MWDDRDFVLEEVRKKGSSLELASARLRADRLVALAASRRDGRALRHASEGLRGDRDFVLEVVGCQGQALQFASEELRADKEVVLRAVACSGRALEHAGGGLLSDKEVVLAAVKQYGAALKYADARLQADKEVVLTAVKENGLALRSASEALRADKELILAALELHSLALRFAHESLRSDRDFMLEMVKRGRGTSWLSLPFASESLRSDKDFVLLAARAVPDVSLDVLSFYSQVASPALLAALSKADFEGAATSALAVEGQSSPAPTLSATLTLHPESARPDSLENRFLCEARLLSGALLACEVRDGESARGIATLDDLARKLLEELERRGEAPQDVKHVFIILERANDEPLRAGVWDWERPLTQLAQ